MGRILLIFGIVFVGHIIIVEAKATYIESQCNLQSYNGLVGRSRRDNLTEFLWKLPPQGLRDRFYNATNGDVPDKVYAFFQCRYDLSLHNCKICVADAVDFLVRSCISYKEGVIYYEECILLYAHRNLFSFNNVTASQDSIYRLSDRLSNVPGFNQLLTKAMDEVFKAAAKNSNGVYFASSEMIITSSDKLYCFAQCSPILDHFECESCLQNAFYGINYFKTRRIQAMVFYRFCQLRYDNESFLLTHSTSSLAPALQGNKEPPMKPAVIVAISSAASFGLVLLIAALCLFLRKKPQHSSGQKLEAVAELGHGVNEEDMDSLESLQIDFKEVQAATCNFSDENKLGRGGFGEVYKGKFSNGEEIAVKRLSKNSQQGDSEFKNEVVLLAKLQHKNLVKLLGFCMLREEKILIYEFLSNSSLDNFLNDPLLRAFLVWEVRFRIITGISRGLLYLHEDSRLKIIHRDLKTSNILLDKAMNAKIADFGLAKLFDSDQTQGNTMRIAGTYGYMAPEYALAGHFSVKSDVYSFGVIVLEIVSGQKSDFFQQEPNEGLLNRAWRLWNEDATLELIDPLLANKFSEEEVMLCIRIGLLCVQEDAAQRPTMASIVHALNGELITLPLPNAPRIFTITSKPENDVQHKNLNEIDGAYSGTLNITDNYTR